MQKNILQISIKNILKNYYQIIQNRKNSNSTKKRYNRIMSQNQLNRNKVYFFFFMKFDLFLLTIIIILEIFMSKKKIIIIVKFYFSNIIL